MNVPGARIPEWEEFKEFVINERGREVDSSFKSAFLCIKDYFTALEFNKQNFRHFIQELRTGAIRGTTLSNSTVNKYIVVGKHVALFLDVHFLRDYRKLPNEGRKLERNILSRNELKDLINCSIKRSREHTEVNRRYKAVIATLIYTGMRPHELCNLKWLDYNGMYFQIERNKTRTPRKVPVVDKLKILIDRLPHHNEYIFGSRQGRLKPQSINTEIRTRCVQMKWTKHITAYDLRHTFDTLLILNGGEKTLKEVARIAGHSIETAYKIYLDMSVEHLKDTIEATHPLLAKSQSIDSFKRVVSEMLSKLIDTSRYSIDITITPKSNDKRRLTIS